MADAQAVPPLPPAGEIVSTAALYNTQISLYRNTLAFGGIRSPSVIWSSMLRDDGTAMLYYRELEEKDTDVANALDTLKLSVLERAHSVKPADDTPLAAEIRDFVQAQLDGVPNFHGVVDNLLDAPGYGFSVAELIFDTSMGQANLLDIKDCPQELFLFGDRFQPQIGPLQFLDMPQASSGTPVPEDKFIVFSYRPRSRNRMGRPLLRSIFWSSWFKRNMQRLWVQYAEKGPGTAVVRYQDADDPKQRQEAADLAQALISQVALGVPAGFEYDKELLTIARAMNPDVHEHFYQAMQLDIVRRILGETLTSFGSEKGRGSQSLGNVHSDTLEKKSIELCKMAASVVNRQLIRPLVLWNYGPNVPMPTWGYETEQAEDMDKRLNIDKGLQGMGLTFTESYLRDRYEVPAPAAGDVIVQPNPNVPLTGSVPTTGDTSFSETGNEAAAQAELKEFDRLADQLRSESVDLLQSRVREITDGLAPGGR